MLKFALRRNLIYPLQLIISNLVRQLLKDFLGSQFNFENSLTYTPLMYFGELIGGAVLRLIQKRFFKKEKEKQKEQYFMSIKLIKTEMSDFLPLDGNFKMIFIIFATAFLDGTQFLIWAIYIPQFTKLSITFISRLSGISTISAALYYVYVLRLPIQKHHKFSLLIIGICIVIVIIFEFIYQEIDTSFGYNDFIVVIIYILITHIFAPLVDLLEKYLFEYDYLDPFIVLAYEGLFGFLLSFFLFFIPGYLDDITLIFKTNSGWELTLFIFLIIFYIILCSLRNAFKMVTTKLYTPMTRTLTDNIITPIYLLYYLIRDEDFTKGEDRNIPYFIINLILSLIITFCGCVYNEFIILFFCGLERNTHDQISKRANLVYELDEMIVFNEEDDELEEI